MIYFFIIIIFAQFLFFCIVMLIWPLLKLADPEQIFTD